jgi:hypothetical protein
MKILIYKFPYKNSAAKMLKPLQSCHLVVSNDNILVKSKIPMTSPTQTQWADLQGTRRSKVNLRKSSTKIAQV